MQNRKPTPSGVFSRRSLLRAGAASAAAGSVAAMSGPAAAATSSPANDVAPLVVETRIRVLQKKMTDGETTAVDIVRAYLRRIEQVDRSGPALNSVIEVNPDAVAIAAQLDAERAAGRKRGPLHGIPIMLKDNIGTGDAMETTAGSLALAGCRPDRDATVAARLRAAGAVILGKTNLSEWANFRGFQSSSGWSGRGGQTRNPWAIDRNPCGSSSGSGAAVSASLAAAALGTETDGSIVCPSATTGVVGIKPTVGLTSRAGVVPISHSQDTVGPMARTVTDAALVLGALVSPDPRDPATQDSRGKFHTDYTSFLDAHGLRGARIGVPRGSGFWGYSPETDAVAEQALRDLAAAGATVVDGTEFPSAAEMASSGAEFDVLLYEFKHDIRAYLAELPDRAGCPRNLQDLIAFNDSHAAKELQWFGQEIFLLAQEKGPLTDPAYQKALADDRRIGGAQGIDAVLRRHNLDALVAPTGSPAWKTDLVNGDLFLGGSSSPAAMAGYPIVTVPAGFSHGLPVGISFVGTAYAEPTLLKLAYAYEQATGWRHKPTYRGCDPSGA